MSDVIFFLFLMFKNKSFEFKFTFEFHKCEVSEEFDKSHALG
jgi:hypothetical protein